MRIPTYWARHDFTARKADGTPVTRTALGWSSTSQVEAERHAQQRAERAVARAVAGQFEQYEYASVPPREPVLQTLDLAGQIIALVTRNRYGSRVLNTDRVMFADIDLPWLPVPATGWRAVWQRFVVGPKYEMAPDDPTLERVDAWHRAHPETSMRIYRTFAGVRLLFTDRQYDPADPGVHQMLESLGSDRLYVQLTKNQQTFRARLSAKPWRCGVSRAPLGSQMKYPEWVKQLEAWAAPYEAQVSQFATCRFVRQLGDPADDPVIEAVRLLHDQHALRPDRPLA